MGLMPTRCVADPARLICPPDACATRSSAALLGDPPPPTHRPVARPGPAVPRSRTRFFCARGQGTKARLRQTALTERRLPS